MRRRQGARARLGGMLIAALGALTLLALPSVAAARDRNHDHIPDRWEKRHHLSLKVNQARRDQDHDHLNNRGEFLFRDNPRNKDTNHDGVMDGEENAGTIASYDTETGTLVINLYGGGTISGQVSDRTRIHCGHGCPGHQPEGEGESEASTSDRGPQGDPLGPPPSGEEGDDAEGDGPEGDDAEDGPEGGEMPPGHDGPPPGSSEDSGQGSAHSRGSCTTAALVEGAIVREADLKIANGVAVFTKIDLAKPQQEGSQEASQ